MKTQITFEKKGVTFTLTCRDGRYLRLTADAGKFWVIGEYEDEFEYGFGNVTLEGDVLKLDAPLLYRMPDGVDGSGFVVSQEIIDWVAANQVNEKPISWEQQQRDRKQQDAMDRINEKPVWMDESQWVEDIFVASGSELDGLLAAIARYDDRWQKARKQAIETGEPVFVHATEHDASAITYIGQSGWMQPDGTIDTRSYHDL